MVFGSENNRVALTNPVTLVSAGGPQAAIISGGTQTRCVYVGTNATLIGFTLTNGHTLVSGDLTNEQSGGGVWCGNGAVVSNCVAVGNFGSAVYGLGGGIFGGTIWNSVLTNNNAGMGSGAAMAVLNNCLAISNGWSDGRYGGGLDGGTASNCTFTANFGSNDGGGVADSTLYNCALGTNASSNGAGGASQSSLYHCTVTGNYGNTGGTAGSTNYSCILSRNSGVQGGGANAGYAYNSIIVSNTAGFGGGVQNCRLLHCVVVGNTATNTGGGVNTGPGAPAYNSIVYYNNSLHFPSSQNQSGDAMANCCTIPATGNCFTNEPLFVNWAAGDFHLQSNSPCINSGDNSYDTNRFPFAALTNDFDANPRMIGSAPDVGAYEYPTPASILPYSWLWNYGLATDGSADFADSDGDGMSNYAEWRARTNPTDATSVLALQAPVVTETNATITWQSVLGVHYYIQSTPDLLAQPFQTFASNIVATDVTTTYTDTNAMSGFSLFYRVGVQ